MTSLFQRNVQIFPVIEYICRRVPVTGSISYSWKRHRQYTTTTDHRL